MRGEEHSAAVAAVWQSQESRETRAAESDEPAAHMQQPTAMPTADAPPKSRHRAADFPLYFLF